MKTCNKCKIHMNTTNEYCPLCHQTLDGENDPNYVELYQKRQSSKQLSNKAKKIILFVTILIIASLGVGNITYNSDTFWSLIPIGSIIYFWMLVRFSFFSRTNSVIRITGITIIVILLLLFINLATPHTMLWSLDYVMPSLLMTNNTLILIILWIRKRKFREYGPQLLLLILLSLIPLGLYFLDIVKVYTIASITFTHGLLLLGFLIIFYPKMLLSVLKKIFHV